MVNQAPVRRLEHKNINLSNLNENQINSQQDYSTLLTYYNNNRQRCDSNINALRRVIYIKSAQYKICEGYAIMSKYNDDDILTILQNQIAIKNYNYNLLRYISLVNIKSHEFIIKHFDQNTLFKLYQYDTNENILNLFLKYTELLPSNLIYTIIVNKMYNYINKQPLLKLYVGFENKFTDKEKDEILKLGIRAGYIDLIKHIIQVRKLINIESIILNALYLTSQTSINIIIMLLVENGFKVDKQFIIDLIKHRKYITNIEQFGIEIDQEIVLACARSSFYPPSYKYSFLPDETVLIVECSKDNNFDKINDLVLKGCKFTQKCLEAACSVRYNSKVINLLLNKCKIKPTELSLENYQKCHDMPALTNLMNNYLPKPEDKKKEELYNCLLDTKSLITIEKLDKEFNKDKEYIIKSKICKLLALKSNKSTIQNLYDNMLKYFVINNLVIGRYILINDTLSNILKLNKGTILDIDELNTMITYFIKE